MTYLGNPNGAKQFWSKWTFTIREAGKYPSYGEVQPNIAKWLRAGFGSAGTARVVRTLPGWKIECFIEGPPAHDPGYVKSVRRNFQMGFVEKGFGPFATGDVEVQVLAGDVEDGGPRRQVIVADNLVVEDMIHGGL